MKRALAILVITICIFWTIPIADWGECANESIIRVTGAGSMFGRLHTLSQLYEKTNPGVEIDVENNRDVDFGFAELIKGRTDIAMASRKISEKEKQEAKANGIELVESLIGHGGIVIVTHGSNPLDELTIAQVQKLLRGDCVAWKEFGGRDEPVKVFGVGEKHPGTVVYVRDDLLGKTPFCPTAEILPDFPSVLKKVAATPGSIGYVRIRDAFEFPGAGPCKIMRIKGGAGAEPVMPCRASVADGTYPFRRPYYLYLNSKADPNARKFADFIVSKGWGQQNL